MVRLRFLDTGRCVAMAMMVLAHARDGLMASEANGHWLARLHDHTRGFTAPLFFIVSGWAFSVATLPRAHDFERPGPALRSRVLRIGTLFVTGKLLTLPWWHGGFPSAVPAELWLPFTTSGVLECLAFAMLTAQLLVVVAPGRRAFAAASCALAAGAVLGAAGLQDVAEPWPLLARGVFNADGVGGGFPLAPFAAYFWLGAALGAFGLRRGFTCAAIAAPVLLLGVALDPVLSSDWAGSRAATASPALFLSRSGWVLFGLAALATAHELLPARLSLQRLSSRAFTFYVGHMVLLWGVPFVPGLVHRLQRGLDVAGVLAVTLAMLTALGALALLTERDDPEAELHRASSG